MTIKVTHLCEDASSSWISTIKFAVKDLGQVEWYSAIFISRTATSIHLSQSAYMEEILSKQGMQGAHKQSMPILHGVDVQAITNLKDWPTYDATVGGRSNERQRIRRSIRMARRFYPSRSSIQSNVIRTIATTLLRDCISNHARQLPILARHSHSGHCILQKHLTTQ